MHFKSTWIWCTRVTVRTKSVSNALWIWRNTLRRVMTARKVKQQHDCIVYPHMHVCSSTVLACFCNIDLYIFPLKKCNLWLLCDKTWNVLISSYREWSWLPVTTKRTTSVHYKTTKAYKSKWYVSSHFTVYSHLQGEMQQFAAKIIFNQLFIAKTS